MTLLATTTHNSLAVWSALSSALLALLAALCAFFPRFLLFLAATANQHVSVDDYTVLTPLESFLAVQLSLVLAALSLALILNVSIRCCSTPSDLSDQRPTFFFIFPFPPICIRSLFLLVSDDFYLTTATQPTADDTLRNHHHPTTRPRLWDR